MLSGSSFFFIKAKKMYQLFQETAWMLWYSVLKELTHFIVKGCLQIVLLLRLMLGWELSQEVCQPAWTQSSQSQPSELPERKLKRQYHTASDSAFITPLQIQVQNRQAENILLDAEQALCTGRQSRFHKARLSSLLLVAIFSQLGKILRKGRWLERDTWLSWRTVLLLGWEPETSFRF